MYIQAVNIEIFTNVQNENHKPKKQTHRAQESEINHVIQTQINFF